MQPNYPRAALLAFIAYNGWTVSDVLLRTLSEAGVADGQIIFITSLSGLVTISFYCALRGNLPRLRAKRPSLLLAVGLCQLAAFLCWLTALPRLPLANLYTTIFLTPMAVAIAAAIVLKERPGWKRALAIGAGFFGVVVSANPLHLSLHGGSLVAYAAAAGDVTAMAIQAPILRIAATRESSESIAFYQRLVLFAAGAVFCAVHGLAPMRAALVGIACFSGVIGSLCWIMMARAYSHAAASAVAPFQYVQLIAGALFGYFIWHSVPDARLIAGASIIVISGAWLVRHERRLGRVPVTEAL